MGACGLTAAVVLLLASALLLPEPASASGRRSLLEGGNPNSGEEAPAPADSAGRTPKDDDTSKKSGQSSASGQQAESNRHQESPPPVPPPPASAPPPPPPATQETGSQNPASPPPGGPGPNGGTGKEQTGSEGKREETDKLKEAMEKCDVLHKCTSEEEVAGKKFSACLQVSRDASVGSYTIIVHNEGQHDIDVHVKEPSSYINNDKKPPHLMKGAFEQMNITYTTSDGGNIILSGGEKLDCIIHVGQPVGRQSVSDFQQQLQQFAVAMRLNPIYGASFFVFTVVFIGAVCACCKFAKRRGNGVPYQQLEMGGQAPNSSGVDNTASTTDGWEDGWDDDWDDEEAPAGPADKKPTSSVSANGLPLRSQTNSKDGWDVDWDD